MTTHKSDQINKVINESDKSLNLHEIKAKTGAGSGYKQQAPNSESKPIHDVFVNSSKSDKIHDAVSSTEGKVNLHKIKAQTGAGNGYSNTEGASQNTSSSYSSFDNNKFDNIYKVVTNIEGKANLHKIKAQTGAGNGYANNQKLEGGAESTQKFDSSTEEHAHRSHKIHAVFHAHDRKLNLHQIKAHTGAGSGYKH